VSPRKKKKGKTRQAASTLQAPALTKGLEVLEFLSGQTEPFAVSELARALGKSRNEIYRTVIVLERSAYLARTDTDRFSVTRKLFDLSMRAPPQRNLLAKALPEMERLSAETLQSCHLTVASGSDMVVVARVESPDVLGFSVRIGYRRPLNQSASGHVLFAYQTESTRAAWCSLQASKEDRNRWADLQRGAAAIREMGFFLAPSVYVDAVTDIAVPVTFGAGDIAIAALVMPFIGGRSAKISLTRAANATKEAAQRISHELA
jgi:DNA-binding IclR family transcriptional regulator